MPKKSQINEYSDKIRGHFQNEEMKKWRTFTQETIQQAGWVATKPPAPGIVRDVMLNKKISIK